MDRTIAFATLCFLLFGVVPLLRRQLDLRVGLRAPVGRMRGATTKRCGDIVEEWQQEQTVRRRALT